MLDGAETTADSARRYTKRMTEAYELTHNELIAARKQIFEQQKLRETRKKRKKGQTDCFRGSVRLQY